ncbi:MAG: FHA domain-containing protein [Rikenellaceae bacterium]
MENVQKIKCPVCGAVLTIKTIPGLENKSISCPICKVTSKFTDYKKPSETVSKPEEDVKTAYFNGNNASQQTGANNNTIGQLRHVDSRKLYSLKLGTNIVGRKAVTSKADVQIDTNDKTMSRSHSLIEVIKLDNGAYVHHFSNANNKNETFLDSQKVGTGDKFILNDGDTIKMANVVLKFVILNGEETEC